MIINLHNYEEFFILYVDNELTASDRQSVEEFIQKNPELREELDILMQYKLVPDNTILFEGKDRLYHYDEVSTGEDEPGQLDELLMLYVDDEMNAGERIKMEDYISHHPAAKKELDLLLRTKAEPESITFPDKSLLYRTEKAPGRVFGLPPRWWKVAAAAILLVAVGLSIGIIANRRSADEKIAKIAPARETTKPSELPSNPENVAANKKEEPKKPVATPLIEKAADNIASVTPTINKKKKNAVVENNIVEKAATPEKENQAVVAYSDQKLPDNARENETTGTINSKGKIRPEEENTNNNIDPQEFTAKIPVTPNTTQALYPETASREDLAQSGGKKSRFRGIFRKLTRTFEKKTNINAADDDDRVLIGGLAIKL